jgi:hypothetical protein
MTHTHTCLLLLQAGKDALQLVSDRAQAGLVGRVPRHLQLQRGIQCRPPHL